MRTKSGTFIAVLSTLGLLASCAQMSPLEAQYDSTRKAAQNARTYADHNNLAKQYENTAKEMLIKAEEQRKLLEQYEEKGYLYGRQAQDVQSRTWALLNKYKQGAEETIHQAAFHQRMASELAKRDYAGPGETPSQQNRENEAKIGSDPKDRI